MIKMSMSTYNIVDIIRMKVDFIQTFQNVVGIPGASRVNQDGHIRFCQKGHGARSFEYINLISGFDAVAFLQQSKIKHLENKNIIELHKCQ